MLTVSDGLLVSLEYSLRLDDGELVDSSDGRGPLQFVQGQGRIIAGLEQALYGMAHGDRKSVLVEPDRGYGEYDSDLFEVIPRSAFPDNRDLEEGMGFRMRAENGVVVAYVHGLAEDEVTLNLNHPLAGKNLHFDVRIADLREATPEELEGSCSNCSGCGGNCH